MSFRSLLNQRMIIKEFMFTTKDTYDRQRGEFTVVKTNVPCRVAHSSGQEFYRDSKLVVSTHVIFARTDFIIVQGCILTVEETNDFDVLYVAKRSDRSSLGFLPSINRWHHYEISTKLVDPQLQSGRDDP